MTDFHFGFNLDSPSKVDKWRDWLKKNDSDLRRHHKDTYRSIKFQDPNGHWIEISYEE